MRGVIRSGYGLRTAILWQAFGWGRGCRFWSLWGLPLVGFFSPRSGRWPKRGECAAG